MRKVHLLATCALGVVLTTGCSTKNVDLASDKNMSEANTTVIESPAVVESKAVLQGVDVVKKALEEKMKSVYFAFNSYLLANDMKDTISENKKLLEKVKVVRIEGNCDERGSDEYNVALGLKRAQSAKIHLEQNGLKGVEIQTVSLGETQPVCQEKTETCWAKNRRVDFKIP